MRGSLWRRDLADSGSPYKPANFMSVSNFNQETLQFLCMTLRDLTPKELQRLQKRCYREQNDWIATPKQTLTIDAAFRAAWSLGLKCGLEYCPPTKTKRKGNA